MSTQQRNDAREYERLVYGWLACCNLEGELSHDPEAVRYYRQRQREIERAMRKFL
jgi:hypothetical protein